MNLGTQEILVIGLIALLLFGQRLPEVMRSLGKGVMEFKKGMNDLQDEFRTASMTPDAPARTAPGEHLTHHEEPTAPKFEPPPADVPVPAASSPPDSHSAA